MKAALNKLLLPAVGLAMLLLTSCSSVQAPFHSKAYRPTNLDDVRVKVSLDKMNVYVMERDKVLLVTPTTIGTAEDPTPKGDFKIFKKIEHKRSYTYGFHVNDASKQIHPGKSANTPDGQRYVGYPMPYWVEFHPAYGFHSGGVWPVPRSHGCLRLHPNVAPKFYELVKVGTPVNIAQSQPEDLTIGKNVKRPSDYADPDPPASFLITGNVFVDPNFPLFEEGPAPSPAEY